MNTSFASFASWILFSNVPLQVLHPVSLEQSLNQQQYHGDVPEQLACMLPEMSVAENTSMSSVLFDEYSASSIPNLIGIVFSLRSE